MKLVIAGKNNIAVDVLKYAIKFKNIEVFVVLNRTENFINGFQKSLGFYAKLWNVPIVLLTDVYCFNEAIFLSLEFDQIIKPNLFKNRKLYNIHFSLLPEYKGMYTSALPILYGEIKSGVTLHIIDEGIDTGDIIAQKDFEICEKETARTMYFKYIEHGTQLVIKNLKNILDNSIKTFPQIQLNSTYYGKNSIDYKNLKIDYRKTACQIDRQLRAFSFREYQLPKYNEYDIGTWEVLNQKSKLKPGSLINRVGNKIHIATIDFDMNLYIDYYKNLWEYCRLNDLSSLKNLLKSTDLNLETKTKEGWTALIIAVYNGALECAEFLIKQEADFTATNYNGTTVLMYAKAAALKTKDTRIINRLLQLGVNINEKDVYGKTVVDWVEKEDVELYDFFKSKL